MAKYLVRCEVSYSKIVEADSKIEAIEKAPDVGGGAAELEWDQVHGPDYEAELESSPL